jgi:hypothetical protein
VRLRYELQGRRSAPKVMRTRSMGKRMVCVLRRPSAHPGPRAFWLGGGCEGACGHRVSSRWRGPTRLAGRQRARLSVLADLASGCEGLKSHKEQEQGDNTPAAAGLGDKAMRARRAIAALRQAAKLGVCTPSRAPSRAGTQARPGCSDDALCAPFIVMEAPDREEGSERHAMQADARILACALDVRARLERQQPEEEASAEDDHTARTCPGLACDVVLVTQDVNLQLLAAVASDGVPMRALSMPELRRELQGREAVWRRAYSQQLARSAVAAAVCAKTTFS